MMPGARQFRLGVLCALGSAATFALFTPLAKLLFTGLPALEASGLAYLISGVVLVFLGGFPRTDRYGGRLRRADMPYLAASILCGGVLAPALLLIGLRLVPAHQAALLLNLEAVFTITAGVVIGRERPGWRAYAGAAGIIVAGVAISLNTAVGEAGSGAGGAAPVGAAAAAPLEEKAAGSLLGALLIAAACASWSTDCTVSRWLSARDPRQVTMIKGLAAGSVSLMLAVPAGLVLPTPAEWSGLLITGSLSLGLSIVLYMLALRFMGIAMSGAVFAVSTPMSFLLSVLLLGERPGALGIGALLLTLAATVLLARDRPKTDLVQPTAAVKPTTTLEGHGASRRSR